MGRNRLRVAAQDLLNLFECQVLRRKTRRRCRGGMQALRKRHRIPVSHAREGDARIPISIGRPRRCIFLGCFAHGLKVR